MVCCQDPEKFTFSIQTAGQFFKMIVQSLLLHLTGKAKCHLEGMPTYSCLLEIRSYSKMGWMNGEQQVRKLRKEN
jgi:hypothetical protein